MFDPKRIAQLDSGIGSLIEDYAFLYGWTAILRPSRIVEIGTNTGVSSIVMAHALEDMEVDGTIHTVDINPSVIETARRQIAEAGYSTRIKVILGDVSALPPGRFDLAFIDGGHSYEAVYKDLEVLHPKCDVLLLHDANKYPDIRRAAGQFAGERLFLSPVVGRQFSKGSIVAESSPGWLALIPPKTSH